MYAIKGYGSQFIFYQSKITPSSPPTICKNREKTYHVGMFFSHFFRRIAFLSLSILLISTDALFADTLSKEATFYSDSFD